MPTETVGIIKQCFTQTKKGKCMKNYIIHINYFEKLVRENFRNGRM